MAEKYDVITLRGLSAVGNHGVHDYERSGSQVFSADLTLNVDSRLAAQTDDVRNTVDYSALAEEAVKILTGTPVYLIETLADRLAQMALSYPNVFVVEVTVHKPMAPVRHQFQDVAVTIRRERTERESPVVVRNPEVHRVVLALGANLGRPITQLTNAVGALMEVPGLEIDEVSPLYRTKAVLTAGQDPQPDYYNIVVLARTIIDPLELLAATQSIEDQFHRDRTEKWGARTLDIDIIDFDSQAMSFTGLDLPHPRAHQRAFVLLPWKDVAPEDRMPDGTPIADLVETALDVSGILEVTENWLTESEILEEPQLVETSPEESGPEETGPVELGKPEVLVVPPPPPAPPAPPVSSASRTPVEPAAESVLSEKFPEWEGTPISRPAPPRRVRRQAGDDRDFLFQSLARKEEEAEKLETPPVKTFPSRRSLHETTKETAAEMAVETAEGAATEQIALPDWRFPTTTPSPRIVDADVPVWVDDEPSSLRPSPRRRTVRPTPTGTIPVTRPKDGPAK